MYASQLKIAFAFSQIWTEMDPHASVVDDEASKDPRAEKHKLSFDEKDFEGM